MKATLPCHKPFQMSLFSNELPEPGKHVWKDGICVDCGMRKEKSYVKVCDCGCKTPITKHTETTHHGKLTFVFGHETLNLFSDNKIVTYKSKQKKHDDHNHHDKKHTHKKHKKKKHCRHDHR